MCHDAQTHPAHAGHRRRVHRIVVQFGAFHHRSQRTDCHRGRATRRAGRIRSRRRTRRTWRDSDDQQNGDNCSRVSNGRFGAHARDHPNDYRRVRRTRHPDDHRRVRRTCDAFRTVRCACDHRAAPTHDHRANHGPADRGPKNRSHSAAVDHTTREHGPDNRSHSAIGDRTTRELGPDDRSHSSIGVGPSCHRGVAYVGSARRHKGI